MLLKLGGELHLFVPLPNTVTVFHVKKQKSITQFTTSLQEGGNNTFVFKQQKRTEGNSVEVSRRHFGDLKASLVYIVAVVINWATEEEDPISTKEKKNTK